MYLRHTKLLTTLCRGLTEGISEKVNKILEKTTSEEFSRSKQGGTYPRCRPEKIKSF